MNDTLERQGLAADSGRSRQDALYETAEAVLPGAGLGGYALPEDVRFIFARGAGSRVQSVEGRWYIDYVGGAGANILGHAHPAVVEAVREQAGKGLHFFGALNEAAIVLAERLAASIPCAEELIFTTTGSEATFYALRMARAYTGKNKILKFEGAYHGNHDYSAVSVFPKAPGNYPAGSLDTGGVPDVLPDTVLIAPYNDLEVVERLVAEYGDDLAAIIVEPVQRIIFARPGFLAGLRRICDAHGVVLIFDEVVTGFRLALGGGQEYYGVMPDLASYGKIVGGGGPLGCVAGRAEIIDLADPKRKGAPDYAYINGTLHGNPMAAAAGLATLEVLSEPGFHTALHAKAAEVTAAFQDVLDRHGLPALAAGRNSLWQFLFLTAEPVSQADIMSSDLDRMRALDLALLRRGIYVLPGVRRFVSAVNTADDLTRSVEALDAACRTI